MMNAQVRMNAMFLMAALHALTRAVRASLNPQRTCCFFPPNSTARVNRASPSRVHSLSRQPDFRFQRFSTSFLSFHQVRVSSPETRFQNVEKDLDRRTRRNASGQLPALG